MLNSQDEAKIILLTIQFHRIVDKRPAGRQLSQGMSKGWLIDGFATLKGSCVAQVLSGSMAFELWLGTRKLRLALSEKTSLDSIELPVTMHMTIVQEERINDGCRVWKDRIQPGCRANVDE